ncbi:MAG: hypothetical protein ACQESJ_01735 [Bacteroidota bacterium]
MSSYFHYTYIAFFFALLFVFSCKSEKQEKPEEKDVSKEEIDTSAVLLKYNETLFILPSPHQITLQIEKNNVDFNKDLLNSVENYNRYNTNFKQALNIGVYGSDLGYINAYKQGSDGVSFLSVIKKLAEDLGVRGALDGQKFQQIEENMENKDSLIYYTSSAYKSIDSYLKRNNRKEIGALIIAGGWIESVYLLSRAAVESNNQTLINRLGEQKQPLNNLIELLSSYYYDSEKYTRLIDSLVDLAYEYDGIISNYYYKEPQVFPEEQLTVIQSETNVVISKYHLRTIADKIEKIRNKIIE